MTVDDLFLPHTVEGLSFSPGGSVLAYIEQTDIAKLPLGTADSNSTDMGPRLQTKVWLVSTAGGSAPRKIADTQQDGFTYSDPAWSPDGQLLALVSQGGPETGISVWENARGILRRLIKRSVGLQIKPAWVSEHDLMYQFWPQGITELGERGQIPAEVVEREWQKQREGREPTASALESGMDTAPDLQPQARLNILNVLTGRERTLVSGGLRSCKVSPGRDHVACFRVAGVVPPDPKHPVLDYRDYNRYELAIAGTANDAHELRVVKNVASSLLSWSPDGGGLTFLGWPTEDLEPLPRLVKYDVRTGRGEAVRTEELGFVSRYYFRPNTLLWFGSSQIVIRAAREPSDPQRSRSRKDWWLVGPDASPRNLTGWMKSSPAYLIARPDSQSLLAVADGSLWQLGLDGAAGRKLSEGMGKNVTSIAWPNEWTNETKPAANIIVSAGNGDQSGLFLFDSTLGAFKSLARPAQDAYFDSYATQDGTLVFDTFNKARRLIWITPKGETQSHLVAEAKESRVAKDEIAEAAFRKIEYVGGDGQPLTAWLILPIGYEEGRRYPMISFAYAGEVQGDTPSSSNRVSGGMLPLNAQLLAARGYAVLLPSIPLAIAVSDITIEAADPYMELSKNVLPAVDKAIELGIADPKRLGVMGQSFGGFTVYGLITQTKRFQAAVALFGPADFISGYGQFGARTRYGDSLSDRFAMSFFESSLATMGNPPWKDLQRYVRNSPLFYADRVQTPVLILQGDMDYVPIQQGEEFFTAMYRQGKRARFVRYWGEGHGFSSPANIRDMWKQIYAWFDEHLKKPSN